MGDSTVIVNIMLEWTSLRISYFTGRDYRTVERWAGAELAFCAGWTLSVPPVIKDHTPVVVECLHTYPARGSCRAREAASRRSVLRSR